MEVGSIYLSPTQIKLVDYASRYTRSGNMGGITIYEGETLWPFIDGQLDTFYEKHLLQIAMDDLRRIWRWPPDPDVEYYYPSKRDWFNTDDSIGKRIVDTKNVL